MNRTTQLGIVVALFLLPQAGQARLVIRPRVPRPVTSSPPLTPTQQANVGKTSAGNSTRFRLLKSLFRFGRPKSSAPSVTRLAGTLERRRTRFLWYKRDGGDKSRGGRQAQVSAAQQRRYQYQQRRGLQQQIGARFDGRTFQGRMKLYREAGINGRMVKRFERMHKSWAEQYGLTVANQQLMGKVNKFMEAMARLEEHQKRQRRISNRVGRRLAHQAEVVGPQRQRLIGRILQRIRGAEGPRFRIFTRGSATSGGLRGLWRRSLDRFGQGHRPGANLAQRPQRPVQQSNANWGYQPLLAP